MKNENTLKELIDAVFECKEIQYFSNTLGNWTAFASCRNEDNHLWIIKRLCKEFDTGKFRIKPKTKTINYRNYLDASGGVNVWSSISVLSMYEQERRSYFKHWLCDTISIDVDDE